MLCKGKRGVPYRCINLIPHLRKMKRIIFVAVATLMYCSTASAQLIRSEELEEKACEVYGLDKKKPKWEEKAKELIANSTVALDKNNSITWVETIPCGDATQSQLYVILNYWFTQTFNDANSVIKLNDKELGTIIGQGHVDVAGHTGGSNEYDLAIKPIIKVDIKDKKIRVTYTIQAYAVTKQVGGGIIGKLNGTKGVTSIETWPLEKTYPFVEKPESGYKAPKASSKGLVMAAAYSEVVMDKIKAAVQEGIAGNENDAW